LKNRLLAAAAFALALPLSAQSPYLVKDINPTPVEQFSGADPAWFIPFGNAVYFSGWAPTTGREIYRYSAGALELVTDIRPGRFGSEPSLPVRLGEVLLFRATDASDHELWQTDGTSAGTTLLKDINPSGSSNVSVLAVLGTRAVLLVDDGTHSTALWYTDGTAIGTQFLADINPESVTLNAVQARIFSGRVYLAHAGGLWTTDGTIAGTVKLAPGVCWILGAVGSDVLFRTSETLGSIGYLWKTDGTIAGTMYVQAAGVARPGGVTPTSALATASQCLFFGYDGSVVSLRTTDGTAAGTKTLRLFPEYAYSSSLWVSPPPIAYELGLWWFNTPGGLWRSDGTAAGTYQVSSQHATSLVGVFSEVYFLGRTGGFWSSDGTVPGTKLVTSLKAFLPGPLTKIGEQLYFGGDDGTTGVEPWISEDGTTGGTHLLTNMNPEPPPTPGSSDPVVTSAVGDTVHFVTMWVHNLPLFLWRSDGTEGGTVQNLRFSSYGEIQELGVLNGGAYFHKKNDSPPWAEIWRSDSSGATLVTTFDREILRSAVTPNALLLSTGIIGDGIWAIGSGNTAVRLTDASGGELVTVSYLVAEGRYAYFTATGPGGEALYRTEGTAATTEVVIPGFDGAVYGGAGGFVFASCSGASLCRLGTPPGLIVLSSLSGGWHRSRAVAAGPYVYFLRTRQLWRTDGTAQGTIPLDVETDGNPLVAVGNIVFFSSADAGGEELWRSDGTVAGTYRVADINPGPASSQPLFLTAADGWIWFRANDGLSGIELWRSDGTAAGTALAFDLEPGSASSSPGGFKVAGRRMFFAAQTAALGRELWAMPLAAPPALDARGSATAVTLTWTAYTAAAPVTYDVYRASGNTAFTKIGTTSSTGFSDTSVSANNAYFYRVIANGANGALPASSNTDAATTIAFTDDPLVVSLTKVKAAHVNELRSAVNATRAAAGLPSFTFSSAPATGALVRASHITELRTALSAVFDAFNSPASIYTDPSLTAKAIKAAHIQELRNALK
jgi:ELWxxDGT repeat protein